MKKRWGFIVVPVKQRFLIPFRAMCVVLSALFWRNIFNIIDTGETVGRPVRVSVEDYPTNFYLAIIYNLAFALVLLWFASFGSESSDTSSKK
jgi:hypothetical protein